MIRIQIKETGEVKQVDRNTAHELIDKGLAEIYNPTKQKPQTTYPTRQMRPTKTS